MQVSEGCIHPYIWAYTWKPKQDRPQKSSFLPYWLETRLLAEPEEPLSARVVGQQAGETHLAWLSRADITTFSAMPGFESGSWRFKLGHWCLENKHYCSLNHLWPQFLMVEITQVQIRWPLFIPPPWVCGCGPVINNTGVGSILPPWVPSIKPGSAGLPVKYLSLQSHLVGFKAVFLDLENKRHALSSNPYNSVTSWAHAGSKWPLKK